MKRLMLLSLFILSFNALAKIKVEDVAWNPSLTSDQLVSEVYNSSSQDKICSVGFQLSMVDENGLIKSFKKISYLNYILLSRQSYSFIFKKTNIFNTKNLYLGELKYEDALKCQPFTRSLDQISSAVEGALRNSDYDIASEFLTYTKDTSLIKFINVNNSFYNGARDEEDFNLNFIEKEKTTYSLIKATTEIQTCEDQKSLKCGAMYFTQASEACGVREYNKRESESKCGCATRKGGPCIGGCPCKTAKTCAHPSFGVKRYNICAHPSHGVQDVKSCPLKLTTTGALQSCQL